MVDCFAALALIVSIALSSISPVSSSSEPAGPCSQLQITCGLSSTLSTFRPSDFLLLSDNGNVIIRPGMLAYVPTGDGFQAKLYPGEVEVCNMWNSTAEEWYMALGYVENMKAHGHFILWESGFVLNISSFRKLSKSVLAFPVRAIDNSISVWCLIGSAQFQSVPRISALDFKRLEMKSVEEIVPHVNIRKLLQEVKDQNSSDSRLTTDPAIMTEKRVWMKLLVGLFVGGSAFLFFIVLVVTICFHHKRKKRQQSAFENKKSLEVHRIYTPETMVIELKSLKVQKFSLLELSEATNTFNKRIGEGGFGAVYHGMLSDGQAVAVKVRSANSIQGQREFQTELDLLSEIQHENLVQLIGFCPEQQILVYPYMSNGSLQDRLYGEASRRKPLDWITRLNIALGAARGLHYLHSSAGVRCIIHRDVKSSNILLDNSMVAKVADFGFSKYAPQEGDSMVSLEVRGTAGYLDPEYYSTQQLTVKSDVFSFGVVLLEIICGREPLNIHRPRPEWSLVEWAKHYFQEPNIQAIVDPTISSSYTSEAMWRVMEIAMSSVEPRGLHRPTMEDIVRELDDALIIETNASQYMASMSIESLASGGRLSVSDSSKALPPPMPLFYQFDPSPVFSEAMMVGSPDPR